MQDARRPGRRAGVTVMEVLVAMAMVAAVGMLIIPAVLRRLDSSQASAIISNLDNLRSAIVSYRDDVGSYPSHLRQLQTKPGTGGVPSTDICAATVPAWELTKWNGPYVANPISSAGIDVAGVTLTDALVRDVLDGEYLYIPFTGLASAMADEIDISYDGAAGRLSGTLWYSPASCTSTTCLARFYIAISGC